MAARPSATAALLLLLLSFLAVAHCRRFEENLTEVQPDAVVSAGDENGPPNTTPPAVALPAEQEPHGFLRLPSHRLRRHRPCHHGLFHRHHWWARHHGAFGEDAPRRFHRHDVEDLRHMPVLPAGETREVMPVAEPDPDRSLPESDGEVEVASRRETEPSFADADGAHEAAAAHEDEGAAVRAWKQEMLRRWFHHHGMRLHRHHHGEEESHGQEEEEAAAAEGVKRFHHHRHHHDEDETERKRFRHAEHDDDSDSDDEDEEVEEMVRRFRKAVMRRRFGHGRRFHHERRHYGHRHAEDAEKADAQEDGGVVSWIKGLMNRF